MDGGRFWHNILQNAQLRSVAILQEYFLATVVIEIGEGERAPVFEKVQTHDARDIGKCSIAVVGVENIALVAAPGAVGADQFVDRAPSLFVIVRWLGSSGRLSDYLAPEETVEVFVVGCGAAHHTVGDVEIGESLMIEVPGSRSTRPSGRSPTPAATRVASSKCRGVSLEPDSGTYC